jgi:hypothetical protein
MLGCESDDSGEPGWLAEPQRRRVPAIGPGGPLSREACAHRHEVDSLLAELAFEPRLGRLGV